MARDELVHELQLLRAATTADDVQAHFAAIHAALADIERKRSRFLEDAFGAVLRHVWRYVAPERTESSEDEGAEDDDDDDGSARAISPLDAIERCLAFALPLLPPPVEHSQRSAAVDQSDDRVRERAVCVAYLLFLLGHDALTVSHQDAAVAVLRRELSERVERCGIALEAIVSTCRVREELRECARLLLPLAHDASSDDESESESDEDDESTALVALTARAWGLEAFAYFVVESGQEYAFASWSVDGIRALVYELLVAPQAAALEVRSQTERAVPLSLVIAPHAWLFLLAPSIERFLQTDGAERRCGMELLVQTLARVPDAAVPYHSTADSAAPSSRPSFAAACAAFAQRDWLAPLVQLVTNVMVSSPAPEERSQALAALRLLFGKVAVADKFRLLERLLRQCPYANVSAVLMDEVRATTVRTWASLDDAPVSPFATQALGDLLAHVLERASERDLVLQADLIASCASLVRFLAIRDTSNRTGAQSEETNGVSAVLERIQRRLRARISELSPVCGHDSDASTRASNAQYHAADEYNRLLILEAVLASTIAR